MSDQNTAPSATPPLPGAPLASPPNPDFQRLPVGAPGGPPIPPTIPLTVEEYQRLRSLESQLAEHQKRHAEAEAAAEAQRLKIMADKEGAEKALQEQQKAWEQRAATIAAEKTQLEQSWFAEKKATVIGDVFQGIPWAGENPEARASTAAMVRKLMQDDFETTRDASGALVVREKASGRHAAEVIRERLASPQYAIFLSAQNRGGAGTDGTRLPANPNNGGDTFDAFAKQYRERVAAAKQAQSLH